MLAFFGFRNQNRLVFMAFSLAIIFLGYQCDRSDFLTLILAFAIAFAAYLHWIDKKQYRSRKRILTDAIIIRVLLILCIPRLSDDYHRFVWDGEIQTQDHDPYTELPSELTDRNAQLETAFEQMNSRDYYSVYPPVMQWVFHAAAMIPGNNTWYSIIFLRLILILADIGILLVGFEILKLLKRPIADMALYAFNPLVIIELTGNLHFEGLMIFFSLLALYLLMKANTHKQQAISALSFSAGVLTKLVNLLFLPALLRRLGFGKALAYYMLVIGFTALAFYPFLSEALISNFSSSLDLYFRNFEFNASIYALSMELASHWRPHYTAQFVGPILAITSLTVIVLVSLIRKADTWQDFMVTILFVLFIHLLFSSTVHPWYVINLLAISVFTRLRFPVVWSLMVVISYFMYGNDLYEVPWMIALEYAVVLIYFVYELRSKNQLSSG